MYNEKVQNVDVNVKGDFCLCPICKVEGRCTASKGLQRHIRERALSIVCVINVKVRNGLAILFSPTDERINEKCP